MKEASHVDTIGITTPVSGTEPTKELGVGMEHVDNATFFEREIPISFGRLQSSEVVGSQIRKSSIGVGGRKVGVSSHELSEENVNSMICFIEKLIEHVVEHENDNVTYLFENSCIVNMCLLINDE